MITQKEYALKRAKVSPHHFNAILNARERASFTVAEKMAKDFGTAERVFITGSKRERMKAWKVFKAEYAQRAAEKAKAAAGIK